MIRRRAPILVAEAPVEQRTQPPFVALLNASAYVAAPIFRGRAAIGFLHADLYDSGRAPDAIDRDRLGAFAEGLGCAIEAAILYERLRAGRDLAASLWRSTDAVLADPEVEVEPITQRGNLAMAEAGEPRWSQATTGSPIMGLLTKRERRVLALMVQGATNATIGEELVISRGTVKSHVASILRKLGAANRADAVARYFQAVQVS
jgi:DNA-binding CsgD family transcriptional regulator